MYADRIPLTRPVPTTRQRLDDARTCGHTPDQHRHTDGQDADLRDANRAVIELTAENARLRAKLAAAQELAAAARTWRRWRGNTNAAYADACQALEAAVDALPPSLGSPADRAQDEPEREEVRWAYRWIGPDGQVHDEMDATDNAMETAEQRAHRIAAKRLTGTVRGEVLRYRVLTMPAEVVATYPAGVSR